MFKYYVCFFVFSLNTFFQYSNNSLIILVFNAVGFIQYRSIDFMHNNFPRGETLATVAVSLYLFCCGRRNLCGSLSRMNIVMIVVVVILGAVIITGFVISQVYSGRPPPLERPQQQQEEEV